MLFVANLSTGLLEPLQRDVDLSVSAEQIRAMLRSKIEQNVKSGWVKEVSLTDSSREPVERAQIKSRRGEKVGA